jgi:hypothetical protein
MCAYATIVDLALAHGIPAFAWDDGGDFPIYNRTTGGFNEIKDILIHTYNESPNGMKISTLSDTIVKVRWTNRTTKNDSIIVERKVDSGNFAFLAKISPTANSYVDSTTCTGKAYYYRLRANLKDSIEIQSYPVMYRILSTHRVPYSGTAIAIPGTVQAENYDIGGEGLTYHDVDGVNQGGVYRNDGVDIGQYATGKYYVEHVATGEWLEYTINVPSAGNYNITAYVGSPYTGGQFTLQFQNGTTTAFVVNSTGDYLIFKPISNIFRLLPGEQVMRLNITQTPDFDIDYIKISFVTATNEISQEELSIYPNPVNNQLFISGLDQPATVQIYSMNGTLVISENVDGQNAVPIGKLEDGVYMVKITSGNRSWTKKILKNNSSK